MPQMSAACPRHASRRRPRGRGAARGSGRTCAPRRTSCRSLPVIVSKTRRMVPFSDAVASRVPSSVSAMHDSAAVCAFSEKVRRSSESSRRTCPRCVPGHASTVWLGAGHSAHSPRGFATVSISSSCDRSEKLNTVTCQPAARQRRRGYSPRGRRRGRGGARALYSRTTTTRSRRRRTALTSCRKWSGPMSFFRWSSQMITWRRHVALSAALRRHPSRRNGRSPASRAPSSRTARSIWHV